MTGVVAVRPFLDLDDVGAHVGEHQGAGRPRHDMGEIDDLQAGERARRREVDCDRSLCIGCVLLTAPLRGALVEESIEPFAKILARVAHQDEVFALVAASAAVAGGPRACLVAFSVSGAWPATQRAPPRRRASRAPRRSSTTSLSSPTRGRLRRIDQARGEDEILDPRRPDQRRETADIGHRQAIAERARDREIRFWRSWCRCAGRRHAAMPAPPPVQTPLIAAMVGTRHCSSVLEHAVDPVLVVDRVLRRLERAELVDVGARGEGLVAGARAAPAP